MIGKNKNNKPAGDNNNQPQPEDSRISSNEDIMGEIDQSTKKVKKWNFFTHLVKRIKEKQFNPLKKGISGIKEEYQLFTKRKEETVAKYVAYETVVTNATDTLEYYILLIMSCLIASLGLIQNSVAVVIGAMIVAPLMGPILGFAAGTLWGSGKAMFEALTTLLKGIIIVIGITSFMAIIIPMSELSSEILARTKPGVADIIIAVASGVIGAYGYVNNRISSSIPGVAISVALMPPLCTVGIGIGLSDWEVARGAALLFSINLVGISFAALIVFYLVKLYPHVENQEKIAKAKRRFLRNVIISSIILAAIAFPMGYFTIDSIFETLKTNRIREIVEERVNPEQIYSYETAVEESSYYVHIVFYGSPGDGITAEDLEVQVKKELSDPIEIEIYSLK